MGKKNHFLKRVIVILLSFALVFAEIPPVVSDAADNDGSGTVGISKSDFLKTNGRQIQKNYGLGEVVYLRGTNAGGYLLQEFWMCLTSSQDTVKCETDIYNVLTQHFGEAKMRELIKLYQDTYWTESDFDNCANMGMNCIRLPLWYRNLVDANGNLYDDAFSRIDWFVEQAAKRGIYVIIDMHGAPGSQNGRDHSGVDGNDDRATEIAISKFFWGDEAAANQQLYLDLWSKIAARYKDNPAVAGYDLLNEPYCAYRYESGKSDEELHNTLWSVYDRAYKTIRAIDPDHIIIMEATWDPWDLPNPSDYGWTNVMYEYHQYEYSDYDNNEGKQIQSMKNKLKNIEDRAYYNVPSYMGEFAYFNKTETWDEGLKLLNEAGINWTSWTYKTESWQGNWGLFHHLHKGSANENAVNIASDDENTIRQKWANVRTTAENTALTTVMKKYLPGVNKTGQNFVTIPNGEYYITSVENNKVIQTPNGGNDPLAALSDSYTGNAEKLMIENNADGSFSIKTGANEKYVCAVVDENNQLLARSESVGTWEKFLAVRINDSQIGILSSANGKYVKGEFYDGGGNILRAASDSVAGAWEAFTIKKVDGGSVDLGGSVSPDPGISQNPGTSQEGNVIRNPLFTEGENGLSGWETFTNSDASFTKNPTAGFDVDIKNVGNDDWSVQLSQTGMKLEAGKKYKVSVDLSSTATRTVYIALQNFVDNNADETYGKTEPLPSVAANERKTVTFTTDTLTSDTSTGKLYIGLGKMEGAAPAKVTIYSVNVVPEDAGEEPKPQEVKVAKIEPSAGSLELKEGESRKISVTVTPDNATNKEVSYTSSQNEVAGVSSDGTVTAVKEGTATITITAKDGSGVTAQVAVKVAKEEEPKPQEVKVTKIEPSAESLELKEGESRKISVTVTPDNATNKEVSYTSSQNEVAGVSSDGTVTAVKEGTATITITAKDGSGVTAQVAVKVAKEEEEEPKPQEVKVTKIEPSAESLELKEGESRKISVTVTPDNATNKEVSYTSSQNEVAGVSSDGTVTAVKEGTATVTITAKDGSGVTAQVAVKVAKEEEEEPKPQEVKVTEIIPSEQEITLQEGDTRAVTVIVKPDTASNPAVTYSSSDHEVAVVSSSGTITAVGEGLATITITAKDGSGVTVEIAVLVEKKEEEEPAPKPEIEVTEIIPSEQEITLQEGDTRTITVTVKPDTASNPAVTYFSSDHGVAVVSSNGMITAVGEGLATITVIAKDGSGVTAEIAVTVEKNEESKLPEQIAVTKIILSQTQATLIQGDSIVVTADIYPDEASNKEVRYSSSNAEVALVSQNGTRGTIRAVGEGTATITVAAMDGSGVIAKISVTVNKKSSITINPGDEGGTGNGNGNNTQVGNPGTVAKIQVGQTFDYGKFKYKITGIQNGNYTAELTAPLKKTMASVTIPSTVKYDNQIFKVTTIGKSAFKNNKKLKKAIIGKNITGIGAKAFYGCKKLRQITIKSTKLKSKSIGKSAFRSISKTAVIKVPSKKLSAYKKLIKKAKTASTVRVKK